MTPSTPPNLIQFPHPCQVGHQAGAGCIMAGAIGAQGKAIEDIEADQQTQSGALQRIENKVDGLAGRVDDRFQTLFYWLIGTLITLLSAAAALVIAKK